MKLRTKVLGKVLKIGIPISREAETVPPQLRSNLAKIVGEGPALQEFSLKLG